MYESWVLRRLLNLKECLEREIEENTIMRSFIIFPLTAQLDWSDQGR